MREIKFRIFDKNIPINLHETQKGMTPSGEMVYSPLIFQTSYFEEAIDGRYPLMQFTGLKDKNGKDIYEGDLIKFYEGNMYWIFEVVYVPTKACFSLNSKTRFRDIMGDAFTEKLAEIAAERASNHLTDIFMNSYEVIGNIYETPNLKSSRYEENQEK